MSSPYQGNAANITQFSTTTITNATNATPIAITTSAAHLYASGDTVVITGVVGNTAANGTFVIVVTGSTSFTLTGSVGNGAYTSGGTAKDTNLLPYAAQPSNGDVFTVDQLNTYQSNLADKIQFLAVSEGRANGIATLDANTKVTASQIPNRLVSATQTPLTTNFTTTSTTFVDVTGLSLSVAVVAGDIVIIDAPIEASVSTVASGNFVSLAIVDGGSTILTGTTTSIPSTIAITQNMTLVYTVVTTGTLVIKAQAVSTIGTTTVTVVGSSGGSSGQSRIRAQVFRP